MFYFHLITFKYSNRYIWVKLIMNKCSQVNQVIGGRVVDFTVLKVLYSKSTVKCSNF